MKLRPALLLFVLAVGCSETDYGNLGRSSGAGAGTTTAGNGAGTTTAGNGAGTTMSGNGAGTTTSGNGAGTTTSGNGAGTTTSGNGAGTTSSTGTGAGGASGTSSSSSSGGGGMPSTSSGGTGGSIYDTPPTCSSMMTALPVNGANMKPGEACDTCHVLLGQASGHTFDVAGTVYLTAHEPDDCNGVNVSSAVVVVTDATNAVTQIPVNSAGNFYHDDLFGFAPLKTPLQVEVQYNGMTRKMLTPVTVPDCNSCHTETGTMNAPGRIMLP